MSSIPGDHASLLESLDSSQTGSWRQADALGKIDVADSTVLLQKIDYRSINAINGYYVAHIHILQLQLAIYSPHKGDIIV